MALMDVPSAGGRRKRAMLRAHCAIGMALLALAHVARRVTTRDTPMLQLCDSWHGWSGCCVTASLCDKPAEPDTVVLICMCACNAGGQPNARPSEQQSNSSRGMLHEDEIVAARTRSRTLPVCMYACMRPCIVHVCHPVCLHPSLCLSASMSASALW